jgi:hypothetical protein
MAVLQVMNSVYLVYSRYNHYCLSPPILLSYNEFILPVLSNNLAHASFPEIDWQPDQGTQ